MNMKLTPDEKLAYDLYVHNPTQAFNALVKLAKKMFGSTGISSGSKNLDHYMIPTRGPWVRVWLAAPAQGKSTFLRIIAFNAAQNIIAMGLQDTHYVAHITYEEAVDAQEIKYLRAQGFSEEAFWRGEVDPAIIMKAGLTRPDLPIYWLGESMARSNPDSKPMTINLCLDGMRAIWKIEGKLPYVIIFDYVQQAEVEYSSGKRTEKVIEAMKQIIRMGTVTGCAVELGAQARRNSLQNNPPLPLADDIEWAHFIFQLATNVVGIWRPWTTHSKDMSALANGITVNNTSFPLSPNLTVCGPLKQRPAKALGPSIPMLVDPTTLTVTDFPNIGQVAVP